MSFPSGGKWRLDRVSMFAAVVCVATLGSTIESRQGFVTTHEPPSKARISYAEATGALGADGIQLPKELENKPRAELEAAWPAWVAQHDAEIRARLERGEEDSIANLWLFGTSFTRRPPVRQDEIERLGGDASVPELLKDRLEDLIIAVGAPGASERLSHV